MNTEKINAETAFALIYELFKKHPWLVKQEVMTPSDAVAEQEAVAFLLAGDMSQQWAGCSAAARRVVCSLLLDFMLKLQDSNSSLSHSSWVVQANQSKTDQALSVVAAEIRRAHPQLKAIH